MLEIIGLGVSLGAIAGFARGRGVSPVVCVSVALVGFLAIGFFGRWFVGRSESPLVVWVWVCEWAWVGAVAFYVRFVIGAGRPKPDGTWVCKDCLYSNQKYAVVCEACQQPWRPTP